MKQVNDRIILKRNDYDLLIKYIFSHLTPLSGENRNAEQLYEEIKNAVIIEGENSVPEDVIRLNSLVEVEDKLTGRQMKLKIVAPAQAQVSKQYISVYAPLGIALMGYRKGQWIKWEMPSGLREYYIKNVINSA